MTTTQATKRLESTTRRQRTLLNSGVHPTAPVCAHLAAEVATYERILRTNARLGR